jgi:hypothetical protein
MSSSTNPAKELEYIERIIELAQTNSKAKIPTVTDVLKAFDEFISKHYHTLPLIL